jgi:hypothetical protein
MKRILVIGAIISALLGGGVLVKHLLQRSKLNAMKETLKNVAFLYNWAFGDAIQRGTHRFHSTAKSEVARLIPDYMEEEIAETEFYTIVYANDYETNSHYDLPLILVRLGANENRIPYCTKSGLGGIAKRDSNGRVMINFHLKESVDIMELINSGIVKELK